MYITTDKGGKPIKGLDEKTGLFFQIYWLFYSEEGVDFLVLIKGTNITDAINRGMTSQADWVQEGNKISWNWIAGNAKGAKGFSYYDASTKILSRPERDQYMKEIGPIPKSK
jgi:hypothetical protein